MASDNILRRKKLPDRQQRFVHPRMNDAEHFGAAADRLRLLRIVVQAQLRHSPVQGVNERIPLLTCENKSMDERRLLLGIEKKAGRR